MKNLHQDPKKIDMLFDQFYKKYGKPLENDHWGEYLAVSQKGKTILGKDSTEVARKAATVLGTGVFLYKIGERALGKWRTIF